MKKTDIALLLYIVALIAALTLVSGCVSKHPKCAAYDQIQTVEK
jgi:outer membrane murein-binding lipoprotein Lpp